MKNLKQRKQLGNTSRFIFNKINILTIACVTAFLAVMACSTSDDSTTVGDCGDFNWAQEAETQIQAWSNAATLYSTNPTTANCTNYKTAGVNYLNALEDVKNCVPNLALADFNTAIQEAKNELAQLDCP